MREFKLLNVVKFADNPIKIERLKMLGYVEIVKPKRKPKAKGDK